MSSRKTRKKQSKQKLFDLEILLKGLQVALSRDLGGNNIDHPCFKMPRGVLPAVLFGSPPYVFKKLRQVLDFDKRIIWGSDPSFFELSHNAFSDFVESQLTYGLPEPMSQRASRVILLASQICQGILGDFDYDEWFDSCAFGKRAATGLPRSMSYLDKRFERLSGTKEQIQWFKHAMSRDIHLHRAVRTREKGTRFDVADTLNAQAVPKSFKSARIMFPDTIIGGFLSRGLGTYVRARLESSTHIDLAQQQYRHRAWAREASINGRLSTLDMSKASDSFVWRHLQVLLPETWLPAFSACFTPYYNVRSLEDADLWLRSCMLMGSGHTFPVQTMLFYCLAEATRRLLKVRGLVSVYGDDIILPTRCAQPFMTVMHELGFRVNKEKSFYDSPDTLLPSRSLFRESCGGDFMNGIDVRPLMPECDLQGNKDLPRNEYVAWIHKLINGLLDHWSPLEVNISLQFLLSAICITGCELSFVPEDETEHAGIKHYIPAAFLWGLPIARPFLEDGVMRYPKLVFRQRKRPRNPNERSYLWYKYWLQATSHIPDPLYDTATSLTGEPLKSEKGEYRWVGTRRRQQNSGTK